MLDKLIGSSHRIDELETQLLQLGAPKEAGRRKLEVISEAMSETLGTLKAANALGRALVGNITCRQAAVGLHLPRRRPRPREQLVVRAPQTLRIELAEGAICASGVRGLVQFSDLPRRREKSYLETSFSSHEQPEDQSEAFPSRPTRGGSREKRISCGGQGIPGADEDRRCFPQTGRSQQWQREFQVAKRSGVEFGSAVQADHGNHSGHAHALHP